MAVYVDRVRDYGDSVRGQARRYGSRWSHLLADTDDELHAFAAQLKLRRDWAQYPGQPGRSHYDVIPAKRAAAIRAGAIVVDDRTMLAIREMQRLVASGTPVPLHLRCPACGTEHLDLEEWQARPHRTHRCAACEHEWKPYPYATVGVTADVALPLPQRAPRAAVVAGITISRLRDALSGDPDQTRR